MSGMTINYILLAFTGIYSLIVIVRLIQGKGWLSNKILGDVFVFLLFVLVLTATLMGMDYQSFRYMIEGRL
jgi:hypothetical protein